MNRRAERDDDLCNLGSGLRALNYFVGAHFGIYALPVPGFINDVAALADDTTALISWTTVEPASSQVEYGVTSELEIATTPDPGLVVSHRVALSGLRPATTYYYAVSSQKGSESWRSPLYSFTTTNYVTTTRLLIASLHWGRVHLPSRRNR